LVGEEVPQLRVVPAEVVSGAIAVGSYRGSHRPCGLAKFGLVHAVEVLIHEAHPCSDPCRVRTPGSSGATISVSDLDAEVAALDSVGISHEPLVKPIASAWSNSPIQT
jgi:hypothetical protein